MNPVGGSKIFIGLRVASKSEVTASDFVGQDWLEIGGLTNIGQLGDSQEVVSQSIISGGRTRQTKGTVVGQVMENTFLPIWNDPGQARFLAAVKSCHTYAFKVEWSQGCEDGPVVDMFYGFALPGSRAGGDANSAQIRNGSIAVDSNVVDGDGFGPQRAALKAYLATTSGKDNPHSLPAMAAPPVITTTTDTGVSTTYPKRIAMISPAGQILVEGGGAEPVATTFIRGFSATLSGTTRTQVISRITIDTDADAIAFYVIGTLLPYRFLVDGQYVDFSGTVPAATAGTGANYIILTFSTSERRKITIELEQNQSLNGIRIRNAFSYFPPPAQKPIRGIVLGDSVTASADSGYFGDGFVPISGDYLGIELWASGVGGTGYSATNGGTRYKLSGRAAADLDAMGETGKIDLVMVAMGLNDLSNQANVLSDANTAFDIIRSKCPYALVYIIGSWDPYAPSPPGSTYPSLKALIQQAIGARAGFEFLDPQSVAYEKVDAVHPDDAGHRTLGLWLDGAIRAALT